MRYEISTTNWKVMVAGFHSLGTGYKEYLIGIHVSGPQAFYQANDVHPRAGMILDENLLQCR
jgi:hypothetical protein